MKKIMKKFSLKNRGFTLIEVVLVLAIGGLIFLLAFIAFGQATKNRRDTSRRSEASRFISEVENAKGDTNGYGFTSTTIGDFVAQYLGGTKVSGTQGTFTSNNITYTVNYGTSIPSGTTVSSGTGVMYGAQSAKCAGNTITTSGTGTGDYAVLTQLEKGQACRDNQ